MCAFSFDGYTDAVNTCILYPWFLEMDVLELILPWALGHFICRVKKQIWNWLN
jgi:hypothetical protein